MRDAGMRHRKRRNLVGSEVLSLAKACRWTHSGATHRSSLRTTASAT
jgi:hypothetical protein